jgi:glutamate synthase (NADPH/NADH) large chain/glutamate synthase (ferredoxin)
MAGIGVRTLNEVIGHPEYLEQRIVPGHPKANLINLAKLLAPTNTDDIAPRYHTWERNDKLEDRPLDDVILQDAQSTLQTKHKLKLKYNVRNINRSVGTQLSGEIAYRYGDAGLPDGTLEVQLSGSAGQSLGAFLVKGVSLVLVGEANDYVGKGMSGGEIVLKPAPGAKFESSQNAIAGNTVLYGATGGALYVSGVAGERFAVRNSGATAIVEGIGDHGCEYMTNGVVVVLGRTGKNFGAGMSGGLAYVLDDNQNFPSKLNTAMVRIERLSAPEEIDTIKAYIRKHQELTESSYAARLLHDWEKVSQLFWKVIPNEIAKIPAPAAPETVAAKV